MDLKRRITRIGDVAIQVGALVVVVTLVVANLRPGGVFRDWWEDRRELRDFESAMSLTWDELTRRSSSRLGADGSGTDVAVVVEFGDYECPVCRDNDEALRAALAERSDLSLVYIHLPITSSHRKAEGAARAAICADVQGQFASMHERLMTTADWLDDEDWSREARKAGVPDSAAFEACLSADETDQALTRDLELVDALQIRGTPTFVTAERKHAGLITKTQLLALVERP